MKATVESAALLLLSIAEQVSRHDNYRHADDAAAVKNVADIEVRERILVERAIVRQAVTDILAVQAEEGPAYTISVWDGGAIALKDSCDLGQIMGAIMSTDEDSLIVRRSNEVGVFAGRIDLVYGNSGYDVIADNSTSLESVLEGATALAEAIEENAVA